MNIRKLERFQPKGKTWQERVLESPEDFLRPVIDPADYQGRKNEFLDYLHRSMLTKYLSLLGNEVVLDFGCGTGRFTRWLSKRTSFVVGIDIIKEMIDMARKMTRAKNVSFAIYDGVELPFRKESFDCIISAWVLQHVLSEEDLTKISKSLLRCLKRKGRIILMEQVGHGRRTPEDYISAFERNSFDCGCVVDIPIRKSPSVFVEAIRRGLVPKFAFPPLLRLELYMAKKNSD